LSGEIFPHNSEQRAYQRTQLNSAKRSW